MAEKSISYTLLEKLEVVGVDGESLVFMLFKHFSKAVDFKNRRHD